MAKTVTVKLNTEEVELLDRLRVRRSYSLVLRDLIWEDGERRGHVARGKLVPDYANEKA
jgi:hypothetical protein